MEEGIGRVEATMCTWNTAVALDAKSPTTSCGKSEQTLKQFMPLTYHTAYLATYQLCETYM